MTAHKRTIVRTVFMPIVMSITLSGCTTISDWWGGSDRESAPEATALPENPFMQDWYCYPEDAESWDCVEQENPAKVVAIAPLLEAAKARRTPLPVAPPVNFADVDEAETAEAPEIAPVELAQMAVAAAPAASGEPMLATQADLLSQPASFYTVQLLARRDEQAVIQYAQNNGIPLPLYARIRSQGHNWYVLLLGIYPDQVTANRAKLEWMEAKTLKVEPWIRQLGPLQNAIREAGAG